MPSTIFVGDMSDLFHEGRVREVIDRVFAVAASCKHILQLLTKRPDVTLAYLRGIEEEAPGRLRLYLEITMAPSRAARQALEPPMSEPDPPTAELRALYDRVEHLSWNGLRGGRSIPQRHWREWPLRNIWLGTSVERQKEADERREPMRKLSAAGWTTFVSYEPAIGPVDWTGWEFTDQIISGGESGRRDPRPSHPDWHRATRDFCQANGIAYFFKQWGEWLPGQNDPYPHAPAGGGREVAHHQDGSWGAQRTKPTVDSYVTWTDVGEVRRGDQTKYPYARISAWARRVGKKAAGRLLDGRTWDEMPTTRKPSIREAAA
jgi:protein gp37